MSIDRFSTDCDVVSWCKDDVLLLADKVPVSGKKRRRGEMGWAKGLEPSTAGITIRSSAN